MTLRGKPFAAGDDPRRHEFTEEERHRGGVNGYRAAKLILADDITRYAWLYRRVRGHFRRKRREEGGDYEG